MRVSVPHNTDKETARRKVEARLHQLLAQYKHYLSDSEHRWEGDRLVFTGSAKGFKANGTVEVTDSEVIIDGKLPLIARPFEPRIKSTNEEPAVDFHGRVGAHVEDLGIEFFRARQLVSYAVLREKTENQTCLLFLASGEKPYGHPPSLFTPNLRGFRLGRCLQMLSLLPLKVK